ncbi:unnamed protein product, partial [Schistosoma rodhaini]|uniref:Uncharacterized protein n=1 Tax=Schistosoma rodhaini TaxID=6188 RepID=A0AA85FXI9_9TREM
MEHRPPTSILQPKYHLSKLQIFSSILSKYSFILKILYFFFCSSLLFIQKLVFDDFKDPLNINQSIIIILPKSL